MAEPFRRLEMLPGFSEHCINFNPTFPTSPNQRTPAYPDRVFHRGERFKCSKYTSLNVSKTASDHLPVVWIGRFV